MAGRRTPQPKGKRRVVKKKRAYKTAVSDGVRIEAVLDEGKTVDMTRPADGRKLPIPKQLRDVAWKPGCKSPNPKGRPKNKPSVTRLLRQIGDEYAGAHMPDGTFFRKKKIELVARRVYWEAIFGRPWAIEFLTERLEGKVPQRIALGDSDELIIDIVDEMTALSEHDEEVHLDERKS